MSVFVRMSVFVIVLMLGSAIASGPQSISEGHARMSPGEYADAYVHCYHVFMENSSPLYATSLHDLCLFRDKLSLCKQKVKAAFPKVRNWVRVIHEEEVEFVATFWCTHTPVPSIPIYALYFKYYHYPNVYDWFMVLPRDYSAQTRMAYYRAQFAHIALKHINIPCLTRWQPQRNYSDPACPVYQWLSSHYCAVHRYIQYNAKIVDKYLFIWDTYRGLEEQKQRYYHAHTDGLYNWDPSKCPSHPEDPIEKMLSVGDLRDWLKLQVNSSLDQCHASNVAARGGSCFIIHYTRIPPYVDIHLFVQGFCKPIKELRKCWEEVAQMCPIERVNRDMDVLMKLHQLACDLSLQNSSLVWDVIYRWSDAVRKVKGSQVTMQLLSDVMHNIHEKQFYSTGVTALPFASALNTTLTTQPHITSQARILLQQLVFHLNRTNILQTYRYLGLNLLHELYQINYHIAQIKTTALYGPVELFLTIGGFIDYDPKDFTQWTFI